MNRVPDWVNEQFQQWLTENSVQASAYEISFIKKGYYLYKKRIGNQSCHTYIGSIKEDGIHPGKPRKKNSSSSTNGSEIVSVQEFIQTFVPRSVSNKRCYEYGFSRTVIELSTRIPKWKEFYAQTSDIVLLRIIQQISPYSFTRKHNLALDDTSVQLGYARKYLDSLLPIPLSEIMNTVGDIVIFYDDDNSTLELSQITDTHRQFFLNYNMTLEGLINGTEM